MENRKTQKYFPVLRTLAYLCIIVIVLSSFYSNPKQKTRKVEDYMIVEGDDIRYGNNLENFEAKIEGFMEVGWEPVGGSRDCLT